jgi:hypothetical protein
MSPQGDANPGDTMHSSGSRGRSIARAALALCLALASPACGSDDASGPEQGAQTTPLNFQEQQILGVWARFHAYDGSTDYIVFRADRTACDWEEPNGSTSKTEYGQWTWSISGSSTSHPYTVATAGAGINYVFDYPGGDLWPQGFSSLVFSKTSSARQCQ